MVPRPAATRHGGVHRSGDKVRICVVEKALRARMKSIEELPPFDPKYRWVLGLVGVIVQVNAPKCVATVMFRKAGQPDVHVPLPFSAIELVAERLQGRKVRVTDNPDKLRERLAETPAAPQFGPLHHEIMGQEGTVLDQHPFLPLLQIECGQSRVWTPQDCTELLPDDEDRFRLRVIDDPAQLQVLVNATTGLRWDPRMAGVCGKFADLLRQQGAVVTIRVRVGPSEVAQVSLPFQALTKVPGKKEAKGLRRGQKVQLSEMGMLVQPLRRLLPPGVVAEVYDFDPDDDPVVRIGGCIVPVARGFIAAARDDESQPAAASKDGDAPAAEAATTEEVRGLRKGMLVVLSQAGFTNEAMREFLSGADGTVEGFDEDGDPRVSVGDRICLVPRAFVERKDEISVGDRVQLSALGLMQDEVRTFLPAGKVGTVAAMGVGEMVSVDNGEGLKAILPRFLLVVVEGDGGDGGAPVAEASGFSEGDEVVLSEIGRASPAVAFMPGDTRGKIVAVVSPATVAVTSNGRLAEMSTAFLQHAAAQPASDAPETPQQPRMPVGQRVRCSERGRQVQQMAAFLPRDQTGEVTGYDEDGDPMVRAPNGHVAAVLRAFVDPVDDPEPDAAP